MTNQSTLGADVVVPASNLYRKKPVVIQATQWHKNGDHPADYAVDEGGFENGVWRVFPGAERKAKGWEGAIVRYFRHPDVDGETTCRQCGVRMHDHGWIDTLEGGHNVCPGDWIITGVKGEHYPCKPDIFEATYERAAKTLAACMDYPWEHMPEQGRATMRKHAESIIAATSTTAHKEGEA